MKQRKVEHKPIEYVGAIHIHTRLSDGSGGIDDIVKGAQLAKCDFVIISDHDTIKGLRLGWQGWHGDVLAIVGTEVSPKRKHALAIGVDESLLLGGRPLKDVLHDIEQMGGYSFVAHPDSSGTFSNVEPSIFRWSRDELSYASGIELWSFMHDWSRDMSLRSLISRIKRPFDFIKGPQSWLLRHWDKMLMSRDISIIGSLDVHAKKIPIANVNVFPYEFCCKSIRTHILLDSPLSKENVSEDIGKINLALKQGRSFVARDDLTDSAGFEFTIESEGKTYYPGERFFFGEIAKINVNSPAYVKIILICNGEKICVVDDKQNMKEYVKKPGVYRIEAHYKGKPWVFTNPIRAIRPVEVSTDKE